MNHSLAKPAAIFIASIGLAACAVNSNEAADCTVYTYSATDNSGLSGLVYLDEDLEMTLRGQISEQYRKAPICWYTSEGRIAAEPVAKDFEMVKSFEFVRDESGWKLSRTLDQITFPAHDPL